MDGEAALHHRLDHGSVWNLDGNADGISLGAGPGQDPVGQRGQAGAAMLEAPVAQKRAVDVDNGCLVIAGPPVDADEEFDIWHVFCSLYELHSLFRRATTMRTVSCTGARGANFPLGLHRGQRSGHESTGGAHHTGVVRLLPIDCPDSSLRTKP